MALFELWGAQAVGGTTSGTDNMGNLILDHFVAVVFLAMLMVGRGHDVLPQAKPKGMLDSGMLLTGRV